MPGILAHSGAHSRGAGKSNDSFSLVSSFPRPRQTSIRSWVSKDVAWGNFKKSYLIIKKSKMNKAFSGDKSSANEQSLFLLSQG